MNGKIHEVLKLIESHLIGIDEHRKFLPALLPGDEEVMIDCVPAGFHEVNIG